MILPLDAYLINKLKLCQDSVFPLQRWGQQEFQELFMLKILQANPGKRAAVIAVESPTATFS
jgi:hypothetical protein